ncbi:MAG: hypothetical protein LBI79_10315 [Nitrososphaerota archaeon]|jgi:hypothetical protein|nr:hypothetical protein [Nitrososphaerota archaeon]
MSENKTNFIMAVRGYKSVKRQKNANFTDVTALDRSNNKVLLRIVEPLSSEYINLNDVKSMAEVIKRDNYHVAILISKQFTDGALEEMGKQKIQYISEDYMPPFDIQELYLAVVDCAKNQCQKKCGKVVLVISECSEKAADHCKTKVLAVAAKRHLEERTVGLLKNDLKVALALTR